MFKRQSFFDGEVTRLDNDGCVVQWSVEDGAEYNSGVPLDEWGIDNLTPQEYVRLFNGKRSESNYALGET